MNFNYFQVFLAISSNDIKTITNFYIQLLGRQPSVYRDSIYTEFNLETIRLAIFQPQANRQEEFVNLGSSMSLCIEVENLDLAISTLADMGYPPPGEIITASHGREVYAYDPDGNRLILYQSQDIKKPEI